MPPLPARPSGRRRARRAPPWWRTPRRACGALGALPLLVMLRPRAALAATTSGSSSPAALTWMDVSDSNGVSVWTYQLSLDSGGWTSPVQALWAALVQITWQAYRAVVAVAIWLIDWVLSFGWLDTLVGPVRTIANNLTAIVDQFQLQTLLLTVAAFVAVVWMGRGRWALGIYELAVSALVAALALGALADPVGLVAGDDGALLASRDIGLAVADGLARNGQAGGDADALRGEVTDLLTDTFVRQPTQLLNFGTVLDGGPCAAAYDDALTTAAGQTGAEDSALRDAVGSCDESAGDVAADPNAGMLVSAGVMWPAAGIVLGFAMLLAGAVLFSSVFALYLSVKLIVALVAALLPGPARGTLWATVADLLMALVVIAVSVVFLTAYLLMIQGVFAAADPEDSPMETFFFVDMLLLVGCLIYWKLRRRLAKAADRVAQLLATRPSAAATSLPQRGDMSPFHAYAVGQAAGTVAGAGADAARAGSRAGSRATGSAARWTRRHLGPYPSGQAPRRPGGPTSGGGSAPGPDVGGRGPGGGPAAPGGAGGRGGGGGGRAAALLRTGSRVGVAAASGGTSAAVTAAITSVSPRRGTSPSAGSGGAAARLSPGAGTRAAALTRRLQRALPAGPTTSRPTRSTGAPPASSPRPGPSAPAAPTSPTTAPAPAALPTPAPASRGYDRVVRDGQVVLVPRPPTGSSPPGRSAHPRPAVAPVARRPAIPLPPAGRDQQLRAQLTAAAHRPAPPPRRRPAA